MRRERKPTPIIDLISVMGETIYKRNIIHTAEGKGWKIAFHRFFDQTEKRI